MRSSIVALMMSWTDSNPPWIRLSMVLGPRPSISPAGISLERGVSPREMANSAYSKIRVFVDSERHVVVRARYWNSAGVEVKEFATAPESIEQFDGVWVTMKSTMRNLLLDSYTRLIVSELVPNPELDEGAFDLGRLESH